MYNTYVYIMCIYMYMYICIYKCMYGRDKEYEIWEEGFTRG